MSQIRAGKPHHMRVAASEAPLPPSFLIWVASAGGLLRGLIGWVGGRAWVEKGTEQCACDANRFQPRPLSSYHIDNGMEKRK